MPPPPPMGGGMPPPTMGGGMPPPPGGGMGGGLAPNYGGGGGGYPSAQSDVPSALAMQQDERLFNAADTLTNGSNDAAAAYLDRYRTGGQTFGARRGNMGRGGVQQTEKGGAALTDKHGNLI